MNVNTWPLVKEAKYRHRAWHLPVELRDSLWIFRLLPGFAGAFSRTTAQ